jgi:pyruvate carboxylase subunit B
VTKTYHVTVNGKTHEVLFHRKEGNDIHFSIRDTPYVVSVAADSLARSGKGSQTSSLGSVSTPASMATQASSIHDGHIYAPMPGLVVSVNVKEGDTVRAGEGVLILEAMKMENGVSAPRDSKVVKVCVKPGEQVESGSLLIELEEHQ